MIAIDVDTALAELDAMLARMRSLAVPFAKIGGLQQARIRERIQRSKVDPDADIWDPWRPTTEEERVHKGNVNQGLLWDSGQLLEDVVFEATNDGLIVGDTAPYAVYLQEGTPRMVAREMFGWTDDDLVEAEEIVALYIEGVQ
jgi:hypothetical protein